MKIKTTISRILSFVAAGLLAVSATSSIHAQTYTWADNAQGQVYLQCPNGVGGYSYYYYPSNNTWSQSVHIGTACDGVTPIVDQPSNWNPAPPAGIYPGDPGLQGVDIVIGTNDTSQGPVLDADVNVGSVTLLPGTFLAAIGGTRTLQANSLYFQDDGVFPQTQGGSITLGPTDALSGSFLVKSGGTNLLILNATVFSASNVTLEVDSGTLVLPTGYGGGRLDGGTFAISNNATLRLTVDSNAGTFLNGDFTGGGGGTVLFNAGLVANDDGISSGFSLNLPGNMFQWTGGQLESDCTNYGTINMSNQPGIYLGTLANNGMVNMADGCSLDDIGYIQNNLGGIFNLTGSATITGSLRSLNNYGLLKKSGNSATTILGPGLWNYGGTVEVDSGTLILNDGYQGFITNATFVVQGGATLQLTSTNVSSDEIEGTLTGSGGGTVLLNSGKVFSYDNAVLNFPGSMFQWRGGSLGGSGSYMTNIGTINISGPASGFDNFFDNNGNMIQSGAGVVGNIGYSSYFVNDTGGIYQIQNDNGIAVGDFYNNGLLEKTGGTGTNTISAYVVNTGTIQAGSGSLFFTDNEFDQDGGTLTLTPAISFGPGRPFYLNGGTVTGTGTLGGSANNNYVYVRGGVLAPGNPFGVLTVPGGNGIYCLTPAATFSIVLGGPSQFSQLIVSNAAFIQGTLNVTLTNGYVPAIGTQFQIISSPNTGGSFTTLNVPAGISVTYNNTCGVYLTVTGTVPAQVQSPFVAGGNFNFSFGTLNGQSYTIQQNTNLATTNWTFYTSITGNGSLHQFTTPVTNIPRRFFRVRQP